MSKRTPKRGYFKPKCPKKYMGDPTNIVYRSGWEQRVMKYLDQNVNVIRWASDGLDFDNMPRDNAGLAIPYISPFDKRRHRYFPDFYAEMRTRDGEIKKYLLEVKPKKQTEPPVKPKRVTKRYLQEVVNWGNNQAKWDSAKQFCKAKGWEFRILHEDHIGIKHK